jgi:flagellar motor switch protein FliM
VARASSSDLAAARPGEIIALNRTASSPGTLFAQDRPIFTANVARVGQMRAAQILSSIEAPIERKPI